MIRTTRTRGFVVVVVAALCVSASSCQLFGERARCDRALESKLHACAPDEFCDADGFCSKQTDVATCAPKPAPATRALHIDVAPTLGVDALGDELFGKTAVLVADAHGCNTALHDGCAGQTTNPAGTQPLGALASLDDDAIRSTVLAAAPIRFSAPAGFDPKNGFTVEAVFKSPPRAPATGSPPFSAVAAMAGRNGAAGDGWILGVDGSGALAFRAGRFVTSLAAPSPATWHHVLCSVDTPGLGGSAGGAGVLCTLDGQLAGPASDDGSGATLAVPHDLLLGGVEGTATLDGAEVAVVRIWDGGAVAPGVRTVDREDALVDAARARLARYVGLELDASPPRFLLTNSGGPARAQPVLDHFELVDGNWPRLTHAADGARGILLEPDRKNRLDPAVITCATADASDGVISPDGRADACSYLGEPSALPESQVKQAVAIGDPPEFGPGSAFVASAFVRFPPGGAVDGTTLHFHVAGASGGNFQLDTDCRVERGPLGAPQIAVEGVTPPVGCSLQSFADGWVRLIARMTATSNKLVVDIDAHGDVWSPQLELAVDPSTPFALDPGTTVDANHPNERVQDEIVIDAPGLADASSTALRANVVSDGAVLSMSPLFVAADADFGDHIAVLHAFPAAPGVQPSLEVTEKATSLVLGGVVGWGSGQHLKIGGDLGPAIDPCRGCAGGSFGTSLPAPEQWEHAGLVGGGEPGILLNAEVLTSGTEPLPLAFDVQVDAPQPGCLEGAGADVALVACAQGACPEGSPVVWNGKADVVEPGPSLGELAIHGSFHADVSPEKTIDELYLELRFAPSGDDGTVLALSDGDNDFLRVGASGDDLVLDDGQGELQRFAGAWSQPGEWTELSCWLGVLPRCAVNAAAPVDLDRAAAVSGARLAAVDVGGPAAERLAFARLWRVSLAPQSDIARVVGERVAASFGLPAAPRRAGFDVVELRAASATLEREGRTFTVGPHWPRVVDDGGPVYRADDGEGLAVFTRDLSTFDATTVELAFASPPDAALLTLEAPDTVDGDEQLALAQNAGALDVTHLLQGNVLAQVALGGLDAHTLVFGSRGGVLTLEGLSAPPSIRASALAPPLHPMTQATIAAGPGDVVELRRVRLGAR